MDQYHLEDDENEGIKLLVGRPDFLALTPDFTMKQGTNSKMFVRQQNAEIWDIFFNENQPKIVKKVIKSRQIERVA